MRLCTLTCIHDDHEYLEVSLKSTSKLEQFVIVNRVSWNGASRDWERSVQIAEGLGAKVVVGEWQTEEEHRKASFQIARDAGFTHAIIQDSDEIYEPGLLDHLTQIAESDLADRVYCHWDTYWKTPEFVIRPREPFCPCVLINLDRAEYLKLREFGGGRLLLLESTYGIIHHLSYVGSDDRIWRKITSWSHRDEVQRGWWERIWKGWDRDKISRNLHPTHPDHYQFAEKTDALASYFPAGEDAKQKQFQPWPTISVCIPLYGAEQAFKVCVDSLDKCRDLLHDVIVVDNASKDQAASIAEQHDWITLLRNDENRGFAKGSNQAYEASTGEVVLFLNSDAIVTRAGLIELIRALFTHSNVAAAAPLTNFACTEQMIDPCMSHEGMAESFAEVVAERNVDDTETDFAIGFCLAVKRTVLQELGAFDERFVIGGAEDIDICYRFRREGYKVLVAQRSYIHHIGSQTFSEMRSEIDQRQLFDLNNSLFEQKWANDVATGFASHLPTRGRGRIRFDESRRPRKIAISESDVALADITLSMIVKNEERSITECLQSAKPFVRKMQILDTGSTDRTVDLARKCGAIVRETVWPDSFALARTESMAGVESKWIMWIDADDVLPPECGREIVEAVLAAPADVVGFVIPVRFVEKLAHGTQVDHVKVIRNFPGLEWEGRIHEQILPSLRKKATEAGIANGGRLVRLNAYVLHANYDESDEGQRRKRERDKHLLGLDLQDRPDHPFVLFNLGMTAHFLGDHEDAVAWLRKSIGNAGPNESHVRKAYSLLGASLRSLGKIDDAKACFEEGLTAVGDDPEMQFYLAQLASDAGNHDEAVRKYQSVLKVNLDGSFSSIDRGILGYKTYHNLALSYVAADRYAEATQMWWKALEGSFKPEIAAMFGSSALQNKDFEPVRELIARAEASRSFDVWVMLTKGICDSVGLPFKPIILAKVSQYPGEWTLQLAAAETLLNSGQEAEAVPYLLWLNQRSIPQGPFYLGVISQVQGDLARAHAWLQRALTLDPSHEETEKRVQELEAALGILNVHEK